MGISSTDHSMVEFRFVPLPYYRHPPFDLSLQSRLVSAQMKRVEPVDDISHQVAHLIVADMRDIGPRDAVTIGVDHGHIAPVTRPGDRRLARMDSLEVRIAHAKHRHCLGKFGRETPFGFLVHDHIVLRCATSDQRITEVGVPTAANQHWPIVFALLLRTSAPLASTVLPKVLRMQTPPRRAAHKHLITRYLMVAGVGFEPTTFRL